MIVLKWPETAGLLICLNFLRTPWSSSPDDPLAADLENAFCLEIQTEEHLPPEEEEGKGEEENANQEETKEEVDTKPNVLKAWHVAASECIFHRIVKGNPVPNGAFQFQGSFSVSVLRTLGFDHQRLRFLDASRISI